MNSKELREKRGHIGQQMRDFNDSIDTENRDFKPEEQAKWDQMNLDYKGLTHQIERAERLDELDSHRSQIPGRPDTGPDTPEDRSSSGPTKEQRKRAFRAWAYAAEVEPSAEELDLIKMCGINARSNSIMINLSDTESFEQRQRDFQSRRFKGRPEKRALGTGTLAEGGALVPEGFLPRLEEAKLAFNSVEQVAEVIVTDSGADLPIPTTDATSEIGEQIGENQEAGEEDTAFGRQVLKAYEFSSKIIRVPQTLFEDAAFDIGAYISGLLGMRIGRIKAQKFTTGNGAATPYGIVERSILGKTAASATAIAFDELFDLIHSVDPAYREGTGSIGFMFHDNILNSLRKLKDGNGAYLWQENTRVGEPATIAGWPFWNNQNMANAVTTGLKTMLFGELSKYIVRNVRGLKLSRLVERFAEYNQVGFVGIERCDGNLVDVGGAVKHLVQA